jgi:hypothetical protein
MRETPKRPNAHAELLERQSLRQQGVLNAPNKGARGLGGYHGLAYKLRKKWGGKDFPPNWEEIKRTYRP